MPTREKALAGRQQALRIAPTHYVTGRAIRPDDLVTDPAIRPDGLSGGAGKPDAAGLEEIHFGMGCFWGAEKMFWTIPGVLVTSVGYAGGFTPNATYEEVCSGQTGHTEVVRVVYDPAKVSLDELLRVFWEGHDPTQGMRQGGDIGTQYRSTIYFNTPAQEAAARASLEAYQQRLSAAGYGKIATEIAPAGPFYFAEDYHQQYLAKNPNGYCGHGGTGVSCPIGVRA